MALVSSLAALVAAVRARGLDRGACVRPSRRPPRCCCCSSRTCWPSASCCTGMAEWVDVEHDHQGCCLLELVPVHHEQLHHGPPGSGQFARRTAVAVHGGDGGGGDRCPTRRRR
eukprot:scaffold67169_cov68-Phaeocystis_antarctica.AAC.1